MEAALIKILDTLGITTVVLAWIANIDNVKSNILFVVAVCYALGRLYFMLRRQAVALRREEFEQKQREKL
jgi:hypothetical protein